jgi:hypothetical protein
VISTHWLNPLSRSLHDHDVVHFCPGVEKHAPIVRKTSAERPPERRNGSTCTRHAPPSCPCLHRPAARALSVSP